MLELVYQSVITPETHPAGVTDIVRFARSYNRDHDITGILVFDGERFCQLLEGPEEAVSALAARIARDERHHRFEIIYRGLRGAPRRRFPTWNMAYALDFDSEVFGLLARQRGADVARLLEQRAALLDLGVPGIDPAPPP